MRTGAALLLGLVLLTGCSSSPSAKASPKPSPSATSSPSAPATPTPGLKPAGPFHHSTDSVAQGLVAPWALDFAKDGAIWLTERPGRVRVIRNGQVLPDPALTLRVSTTSGCEDGLLGLALKEPNAYLYYTYNGGATNRVSRFAIQGDKLTGEQVILDGIPGGSCYHFGGRLKFGPDGYLYLTTGEGFVASRAADPNNLSACTRTAAARRCTPGASATPRASPSTPRAGCT